MCPEVEVNLNAVMTVLGISLMLAGWLFITVKTVEWLIDIFFCLRGKCRHAERKRRAINELCAAFQLSEIKSGETVRVTTSGGLTILMSRSEND